MEIPQLLTNVTATTIVDPLVVFDPARDLSPAWAQPSDVWASSLETLAPTINQKIADQSLNGESWTDTLQRLLPALAMTWQQREILQVQLERAKAGLPPLPNSDFGAQVSVGLDAQTRNILIYGGIALAALLAWRAFKSRG